MATIKPIEGRTVHQIQSGQVIVDLCSVVKELVENSVDSGATSIDVRFKNQGLDAIEVQDNGAGISPANYESVCLKHHTSKLSTYDDLASLETFGFRGEALASLCALSTLTITTCLPVDVPKGTNLTFEASGRLHGKSVVAAQKGTTVSVERLFHNLPVRRRELDRNIKREWQKVIALLNQYACILTGLKFTVSQQPSKGKRVILFSTKGNSTTRENIINIFSAKMTNALVPLDLTLEMKPSAPGPAAMKAIVSDDAHVQASKEVRVIGHVSRPVHGEGRQTPDRQMFFVNGRPCGLPQFAKTFNEVYRSYNSNQSPFICADIQLDTDMYDVNVSPDKRSIMLHDQHQMLDTLRTSLISLFDDHDYTVPVAQPSSIAPAKAEQGLSQPSTFRFSRRSITPESPSAQSDTEHVDEEEAATCATHRPATHIASFARGSARRIPSANSISRGGPHSQSLLHGWVNTKSTGSGRNTRSVNDQMRASHQNESTDATIPQGSDLSDTDSHPSQSEDVTAGRTDDKEVGAAAVENGAMEEDNISSDDFPSPSRQHIVDEGPIPSLEAEMASDSDGPPPTTHSTKRYVPHMATVTIGDKTRTSWIGSPAKRPRDTSYEEPEDPPQTFFGSRLTQLYAAPDRPSGLEKHRHRSLLPVSDNASDDVSDAGEEELSDNEGGLAETAAAGEPQTSPRRRLSLKDDTSSDETEDSVPSETVPNATLATSQPQAQCHDAQPRAVAFEAARRRKDATTTLQQQLFTNEDGLNTLMTQWKSSAVKLTLEPSISDDIEDITAPDAESKLSLVISRGDFSRMRVAGQFNLGFIIAIRPMSIMADDLEVKSDDELFIIDQHASDEKYNFERLQSETIVQSQRLVQPKRLELTALEEEIVMQNLPAIEANGFKVDVDTSGESAVGARCQLLALPLSRETTFNLTDLEELISLLGDVSSESTHVPRPAKVRKMFAMRACRSSVMIGKALTQGQMYGLVKHMGEMDKPWNCPHGRPTMRHLCQLKAWEQLGWKDDVSAISKTTWADYARD